MNKKYYGIEFSKDFSVNEDIQLLFAYFLFVHPDIPFESVKSLLNDAKLLIKLSLIITRFDCSISGIEPAGLEYSEEYTDKERLFEKLYSWVLEFSFPTEEELSELAEQHFIPLETIIMFLKNTLKDDKFSHGRVLEFLRKFSLSLSNKVIDETLDLYIIKNGKGYTETLEQVDVQANSMPIE